MAGGGETQRLYEKDYSDIFSTLKPYASQWRDIGDALGFTQGELNKIQGNPMLLLQSPPVSYLGQMLSQWLQWAPRDGRGSKAFATRKSLHDALLKSNVAAGLQLPEQFAAVSGENDVEESRSLLLGCNPFELWPKPIENPIFTTIHMNGVRKEKQPQLCPDDLKEAAKKFVNEATILLVTVNKEELAAVYKLLKPPDMGPGDLPKAITYRPPESIKFILGKFGNHNVVVIQARQGGDCRHDVQFAVESLPSVQIIIAVGCAYGRKDKCALGDVLVSTKILAVSNCRVEGGELIIDESSGSTDKLSTSTYDTFARDYSMMKFNCIEKKERDSQVHKGLVISGPILWNDKILLQKLIKRHDRFIGGEMEGQELAQEAYRQKDRKRIVEIIVIKGVSDFGDGSKTKEWQYTASLAAATYAESKLQESPDVYKLHERNGESTTGNSDGKGNTARGAPFGGQVAQQPPNPFTSGFGQQQQMGGAHFGEPSAVPGILPQQQIAGFGQQQPQQLGGLGSAGGGRDPASGGHGQQQQPAQQGFVGGGVQHPQQPPPAAGGATNPFASGSGSTNPFL